MPDSTALTDSDLSSGDRFWLDYLETKVCAGHTPERAAQQLADQLGKPNADRLLAVFQARAGQLRELELPSAMVDGQLGHNYPAWYVGPKSGDTYWPRLRAILAARGLSDEAIESIDRSSTKILSLMPSPGLDQFAARGLVIGYVQSGKTVSFTSLIAKAADAGYRQFIVLSGVHNILRSQTQTRLNRELLGEQGDGWMPLTDEDADFRIGQVTPAAGLLKGAGVSRVIMVVKKNATVLRKIERWLEKAPDSVRSSAPTLIIDDEADQASVNTGANSPSAVNARLRAIAKLLPKSAYVGYTATPFANVFIDPADWEDFYPRDFIVSLPRPDGYFGAERIFGRERLDVEDEGADVDGMDVVRLVPEIDVACLRPAKAADHAQFLPRLSASLEDSLDYFWLATAARRARGANDHSSMLVHTTLRIEQHQRLAALIRDQVSTRTKELTGSPSPTVDRLRRLWVDEQGRVGTDDFTAEAEFSRLAPSLATVVRETEVVVENGSSTQRLTYGDVPKTVIAVGGNTLSRGLTLEGLVVSYFIRAASAYDTLLQMGRWFGYRKGYEDLPRIWMTSELSGYFRDLALVETEIRSEIARFELDRSTPSEYSVRIRTHPALAITSELKMRKAIDASMSFDDRAVQTVLFEQRNESVVRANLAAADDLVVSCPGGRSRSWSNSRLVIRDVPADTVVRFLAAYQFHAHNKQTSKELLLGYIAAQRSVGRLELWTVVVVGRDGASTRKIGGVPFRFLERARIDRGVAEEAYLGVITNQSDLAINLPGTRHGGERPSRPDREASGPLLLVYPIAADSRPKANVGGAGSRVRVPLNAVDHLIGVALQFPPTPTATPQSYKTVDLSGLERESDEVVEDDGEALA